MSDLQKTGLGFIAAGALLILARLVGIAQGEQIAIGLAFALAGGLMYVFGRRQHRRE